MMNAKELRAIVNEVKNKREEKERQERDNWFGQITDGFKPIANKERSQAVVEVPSHICFTEAVEMFHKCGFGVTKSNGYREIIVTW